MPRLKLCYTIILTIECTSVSGFQASNRTCVTAVCICSGRIDTSGSASKAYHAFDICGFSPTFSDLPWYNSASKVCHTLHLTFERFSLFALSCRCADVLSGLYRIFVYRSRMFRPMQFPWVALANCGSKYLDGIALKGQADSLGAGRLSKQVSKNPKKVQYDYTMLPSNAQHPQPQRNLLFP